MALSKRLLVLEGRVGWLVRQRATSRLGEWTLGFEGSPRLSRADKKKADPFLGPPVDHIGSPTWIRTTNTAVNSRVLYR